MPLISHFPLGNLHGEFTMCQILSNPFRYIISFNLPTLGVHLIISILELGKPKKFLKSIQLISCRTGIQTQVRGFDNFTRGGVFRNYGMGLGREGNPTSGMESSSTVSCQLLCANHYQRL